MLQRVKRIDELIGNWLAGGGQVAILVALSLAAILSIIFHILALLHPYSLDYGEAPLIDQAMRLVAGMDIYRPDISTPPYTISNYPPIYLLTQAPFISIFEPNFWSGRLISWISSIASGLFLALIIYTLTKDYLAAIVSGGIFFAFPYVVFWSSLARIDLEALALSLAGLYILLRWSTNRWSLFAGAMFLVAAIFTRQSYALATPLAAFVWTTTHNWRRAILLALLVGVSSVLIVFMLNEMTHGGFLYNIITANVNEFDIGRLAWNMTNLRQTTLILLLFGGGSLILAFRVKPAGEFRTSVWPLTLPYLIGAALSSLTIGKIGSNVNYFLELCAALSLSTGVVLAWSRQGLYKRTTHVVLLFLLVWQTGKMIHVTLYDYGEDLKERRSFSSELRRLENIVAETDGPILADEYMGMITLQGRFLVLQPFEVTQLANAGMWDQEPLVDSIKAKEFPLILIHYFPEYPVFKERWTPEMLSAIYMNYRGVETLAETRVYRPIGTTQ